MEAKRRRLVGAPSRSDVSPILKTRESDVEGEDTNALLKSCLSKITELQNEVSALISKVDRLEDTVSELQEQNTSLEERGAYLERMASALVRLQDDFHFPGSVSSKFYGTDWQHFLARMNTETYEMCNREMKEVTRLESPDTNLILHNEDLMPALTRYPDALRLSTVHEVEIYDVQFSAAALKKLSFALENKSLSSLTWNRSSCLEVNAGIDFVASAARRLGGEDVFKPYFDWFHSAIPDQDAANRLCDAVSSVHTVYFSNSCGESHIIGATILRSLIDPKKEIVKVALRNNNMTGLDRSHATLLASNTRLEKLDLCHNHLSDEDAAVIATGLRRNRKLKLLNIGFNSITNDGFVSLCSAIYSPNMQELVECNHSCLVRWDVPTHPPRDFASRLIHFHNGMLPSEHNPPSPQKEMSNLRHKIFVSFSERNKSNSCAGLHNCGIPGMISIKLAPLAIERVIKCEKDTYSRAYVQELQDHFPGRDVTQTYIDLVPVLSVVFELLREWKMPELLLNK